MNRIVRKQQLSARVFLYEVEAPLIARARRAGHFVIVRVDKHGERIPLTIAQADMTKGTITLVVQSVGVSTRKLVLLNEGDCLADVVGPLGKATHIEHFGTVVCAGGGVGVAPLLPIMQALKAAGNKVVAVLAGRSKNLIILEDRVRDCCDELVIMTDDGSYGQKGLVTNGIEQVLKHQKVDRCFAIGPAVMMKYVCLLTAQYKIPTDVSLNTIMVDGTGMCGACRVSVGGVTKFVCVDGPEFDGHKVDFDEMICRLKAFRPEETEALKQYEDALNGCVGTLPTNGKAVEKDKEGNADSGQLGVWPLGQQHGSELNEGRESEWRCALRRKMPAKQRMAIERVVMPQLPPEQRSNLLRDEVNQGLTLQMAQLEASRCLDCANPGCVEGCPVKIDIPHFVKCIEVGRIIEANDVIRQTSSLPSVCGRVCPQERQCESRCIHHKMNSKPVAVGYLERFAADYARVLEPQHGKKRMDSSCIARKGKVAVVGSGPSGLSFAGTMQKYGYDVTVFEALHELGGVLRYGIPEFRLPNEVLEYEIETMKSGGVKFVKDCLIGKTLNMAQLQDMRYEGIFVGSGAGLPNFMGIPGENATGVMSSNEYLTRVNLMSASDKNSDTPIPLARHVVVIGGGNTAMDSVRTALRLGADTATVVYRRSENEMPARAEEVIHAKEEGVRFLTLHNPLRYVTDEDGHVRLVELQQMCLGEPDASGRRSPVPISGAIDMIEADLVIVSIGVSPNPIIPSSVLGLETGWKGTITVDECMQTSIPTIFAGGDIVRGGATVILAMGDGKRAAEGMRAWLEQAK